MDEDSAVDYTALHSHDQGRPERGASPDAAVPRVSEQEEEGVWAELHGTEETGLLREDTGPRSESHRSTDGGKGLGGSIKNKFMEVMGDRRRKSRRSRLNVSRKMQMSTMADFGLFQEGEDRNAIPEDWGVVSNLDVFFSNLYKFYYNKGVFSIITAGAMNLITLGFTIALSTFLLAFLNWRKLSACVDEFTCGHFSEYIVWDAFSSPSLYTLMVFFYFILFCMYWAWSLIGFIASARDAMEMYRFYTEILKINNRELQTMKWSEIVNRLLALHDGSSAASFKVQINKQKISPLDIALRVMRKDNYLIAFFAKGVLDLTVPLPRFIAPKGYSHIYLTRILEWNLHFCILNHMFTDRFTIRKRFLSDTEGLKKRFWYAGIFNLVLLPFMVLFIVINFFLKNAQEWHSQKAYLGPRQWSTYALWLFRDYNELPHVFEKRINASYPYAVKYQNQFPTPVLSIVARGMAFITGSIVAILLLFSFIEDSIMLHMKMWDRNFIWHLTIFSALFAIARSFIPTPEDQVFAPENAMLALASYTHYMPKRWRHRCHTYDVRDEFFELFQYKAGLFVWEVLSVIMTPYVLCFKLPDCAENIVKFVGDHTVDVEGVGSVCGYALFDFDKYGNKRYGVVQGAESPTEEEDKDQGKLEKSYLNFKENHPDWEGSANGDAMVAKVQAFQRRQNAIALEKSVTSLSASLHLTPTSGALYEHGPDMLRSSVNFRQRRSAGLEEKKQPSPSETAEESKTAGRPQTRFSPQAPVAQDLGASMSENMNAAGLALSAQFLQSLTQAAANENHFYWLEKMYQAQMDGEDIESCCPAEGSAEEERA